VTLFIVPLTTEATAVVTESIKW